jgi:hypothetical protein
MTATTTITTIEQSIRNALSAAGYKYRGHTWLRLQGLGLDAIGINAESGAWVDHRSGERGNFCALAKKLGLGRIGIDAQYRDWQQEQSKRLHYDSQQRAKTLWSRAAPAVLPKKPSHYTQEAWDLAHAWYSACREAVYDYLQSRGLDPQHWMRLIKILPQLEPRYKNQEPVNLDAEMAQKGADFCFLIPMYKRGAPELPGNICGVQRTYLKFAEDKYSKIKKIGRAMLGKKGTTTLTPPPGLLPVSVPVEGPVIGSGEGFETVASFVQEMRHPGVVCWDWSGLKSWSEMLHPTEAAPTVAMLVDYDTSETGQRESAAAVRRIREKGGQAVYLLPPDNVRPDQKGNRDWNDLATQGFDFAAETILAWHRSDEDMAKAPVSPDTPVPLVKQERRDAQVAQAVAEAGERKIAQDIAKKALSEKLPEYEKYLADYEKWESMTPKERKEQEIKRPKMPPLLVKITTGVGKSYLVREIIKNVRESGKIIPILIMTRTHALADEYKNASAEEYHGRSCPIVEPLDPNQGYTIKDMEQNGEKFTPSTCFKYPVIALVAENNHVPALTGCRECAHGRKWTLENFEQDSLPHLAAQKWFAENMVASSVPSCMWLEHQRKIQEEMIVVTPNASYSDTLGTWKSPDGKSIPRLVIVDEIPELTRPVSAHSSHMGLYVSQCDRAIKYFKEKASKTGEDYEQLMADLESAKEVLGELGEILGKSVKGKPKLSDELIQRIKTLKVDWLPAATARWEQAEVRHGREPFVPLRATRAIIDSISTNTHIVDGGQILVQEMSNLGERILRGDKPTILLDATPSEAVEFVVQERGGQVISAIARQNVRIVHYYQYLHGRTFKNKEHQQKELERLLNLKEQMAKEIRRSPTVLTYMGHVELANKQGATDWGYWGRDDIGQDRWKGLDMLIFGGQIFSPVTQARAYNSELMIRRLAGDKESPDWSSDFARRVEVAVGIKIVTAKAPLPTDQKLREWVLRDYGRRMVQAIGRVRAVWADQGNPLHIWIAGGLPLSGLAEYGLEVAEYREEKSENGNSAKARETQERVQAAMASLESADKDASYRAVNKWMEQNGLPGVRYDAWKRIINESSTTLNRDTYEAVDALLDALGAIARIAELHGYDISDAARVMLEFGSEWQIVGGKLIIEASPYGNAGPPDDS